MERKRKVRSLDTREYDELVRVIKEARLEANVSQEELSRDLGQSETYMFKIEGGARRVDAVELVFISRALGFSPSELCNRFLTAIGD